MYTNRLEINTLSGQSIPKKLTYPRDSSRRCLLLIPSARARNFNNHDNEDAWNPPQPRPTNPNGRFFFTRDDSPPMLSDDWRSVRARLVAGEHGSDSLKAAMKITPDEWWAHEITIPEKGCLLLSRREDLGVFSHSIVLITEHESGIGSSGLILNSPTRLYVHMLGLESGPVSSVFAQSPLFFGGPVATNLLHVVHGRPEVIGAEEVMDGVLAGGVDNAADLVVEGKAKAEDFRVMAGYCAWGPRQLEEELSAGTWWCVAASKQLILDCISETAAGWSPLVLAADETELDSPQLRESKKRACWERVLRCAGIRLKEHES